MLDLDKDLPDRIKNQVDGLIDDFVASWHRQSTRGRKPENRRNVLINDLATLFQKNCHWQLRFEGESPNYVEEYRRALRYFLVSVLVANDIDYPDDRLVRLRVVSPAYRIPRP